MRTDFVPADLDTTDWAKIEPYVTQLLERPVSTAEELEQWLLDRSELDAACSQGRAELYIDMTCDTSNEARQQAYTAYLENTAPKLAPAAFELDTRQVELTQATGLNSARYEVLTRDTRSEVELFRPENVPVETELQKLSQKYDQITGAMMVEFEGEERTFPQMARYQESTDRAQREAAWQIGRAS
ncbi:MAG: M3 family oligoendopeptidase, partial [Phycisphaerales bacterium]